MAVGVVPGHKSRVFTEKSLQTVDVVIVDGLFGLIGSPLHALAGADEHLTLEVCPPGEAVLPGEHELGVAE